MPDHSLPLLPRFRIGAGVRSPELPAFLALGPLSREGVVDHLRWLLSPSGGKECRDRLETMAAAGIPVILHAPPTTCTG